MSSPLEMSAISTLDMQGAEAAIRVALAEEGFGVLTEIDVASTLKEKIDVERPPFKILGACSPHLAHRALEHDEAIGLLLPCNVTLSQTSDGVRVSIVDPIVMLGVANEAGEMHELASEAKAKLKRALSSVS